MYIYYIESVLFWALLIGGCIWYSQTKNEKVKVILGNIFKFCLFTIGYAIILSILMLIPTAILSKNSGPEDTGLWAYALIGGCALAPVASIITIILLEKKKKAEENDNSLKKIVILLVILMGILATIGVGTTILNLRSGETILDDETYKITFYDDYIPGAKYDISLKGATLKVNKTSFCSAVDCKSTSEVKTYTYSEKNIEKLNTFIKENFSNNIEVHEDDLTSKQNEVIRGIILSENFFELAIEDYKYKIEYSKSDDTSYDIYFKENKEILVKKSKINKDYDITKIDTYKLDFSKENINILYEYIEKEVAKENKNKIYKYSTLLKDEINIFESIINNDESYLKNIKSSAKLLYTIGYGGIKCLTPTLYLYSDNTYEFYDTFTTSGKSVTPKTGTYDYDMAKLINNIDKYEENPIGPYYINEENGQKYITYNTNKELNELINSLDIKLDKCLEQE